MTVAQQGIPVIPELDSGLPRRMHPAAALILILAAVGHLVWGRLVWSEIPLQTDTGICAYFGGRMFDGAQLYRDLWESKPPGIFWTFALIEGLFGRGDDAALLWLDAVVTVGLCAVTFVAATRFASRGTALCAVCLLSVLLNHRILADWGNNLEKFVALFEMLALLLLLPHGKTGNPSVAGPDRVSSRLIAAGFCCGVALLFKQTAIILPIILIVCMLRGSQAIRIAPGKLRSFLLFAAGLALPWIATVIWLISNDALGGFWRQVVIHDVARASTAETERFQLARWDHWANVGRHLLLALAIFGPALAACVALVRRGSGSTAQSNASRPAGLSLLAAYAVLVTLVFTLAPFGYGHYLLQSLPAATILVAWLCDAGATATVRLARIVAIAAFLIGVLQLNDHFRFLSEPDCDARRAYAFISQRTSGLVQVVEEVSNADQSVMLWPADHAVNYYAKRRTQLEFCQAIDIFRGRVYLLDPPIPQVIDRLQSEPPDTIVDWTPIAVGRSSEGPSSGLTLLVPAGGYSLAEDPDPDHPYLEGRLLYPLKNWLRTNYGGQKRVANLCTVYYRGRPWRDWRDYLPGSEPILAD